MSRFLSALAKVGLVELEEGDAKQPEPSGSTVDTDEIEALLAKHKVDRSDDEPSQPPPAPKEAEAATSPSTAVNAAPVATTEGQPLDVHYAVANVPESPFPAEKLLKVLDGLKAMDANTRKVAIMAMDAADDEWNIQDPILDAQRKVRALDAAKANLTTQAAAAQAQADSDLEAQVTYQAQATTEIRQQIAELETLLQSELETVANEKAAIRSKLSATQESCGREAARFDREIGRLSEIQRIFADHTTSDTH